MHTSRLRGLHSIALVLAVTIAWLPDSDHAAGAGGGGMFGDVNISAILDSLSVSYDKRVRPNYGGPPVEVGVTMYVLSISSVSEVLMVLAIVRSRLSRSLRSRCTAATEQPQTRGCEHAGVMEQTTRMSLHYLL